MTLYLPSQSVAHPAVRIPTLDEDDRARWELIQEEAEWRGKRLRDIRRASGLTIEQLAAVRFPDRNEVGHYTDYELAALEAGTTEITVNGGIQAAYAGMEQEYRELIAVALGATP